MKKISIYLVSILFLILTACGNGEKVEKPDEDETITDEGAFKKIIQSHNVVGFSLLEHVKPDSDNNIFISPTSAFLALLMAYNGAEGNTKKEMEEALGIFNLSVDDVNEASKSLKQLLEHETEEIELSIANSIWLNEDFHFTEQFTEDVKHYYEAEITEIDIQDDSSVTRINDWVSGETNEKIEEIIEAPLHGSMVALLINAVYFNGKWVHEFNEENTKEKTFYAPSGEKITPFMMLEEELEYMENDLFQAVKLPYGKGQMSMEVILPHEQVKIKDMSEQLSLENWEAWQNEFQKTEGILKFPKFELEYEITLNQALQQLGVDEAFQEKEADFSKMIEEDDPLFIHKVKQKTYIDVNEKGTEAAGATSVEMRTTSAGIGDRFNMEVNRPFWFAILDEETEAILFLGLLSSPVQR